MAPQFIYREEATKHIQHQIQLYQTAQQEQLKIEKTLHYQTNIRLHNTVPKKFFPKVPTAHGHTELNSNFLKNYEQLFLDHLDKIIEHNITKLELTKTKMSNIILQTEKYIAMLHVSPNDIQQMNTMFKTQCQLDIQPVTPELCLKHGQTAKRTRTDQDTADQPPTKKALTANDSFLWLGHPPNTSLT